MDPKAVELRAQQLVKEKIGDLVFQIALLRADNEDLQATLAQIEKAGG